MSEYNDNTSTEHIGLTGTMDYPLHAWLCQQTTLGPTNVAAAMVESKTVREAKAILAKREAEQRFEQAYQALCASNDACAKLQNIIGYVSIHIQDRWMVSKLTTEEKELWADAVDAWGARLYADDPKSLAELTPYDRWWRNA